MLAYNVGLINESKNYVVMKADNEINKCIALER